MKNLSILFCLLIVFGSCKNEASSTTDTTSTEQKTDETTETQETVVADRIKKLTVKNPADYDVNFIKNLRQQPLGEVVLDGNLFIEDGQEMSFASYPELNKEIVLSGKKDNLNIALTIKRINQTSIEYSLEMIETDQPAYKAKGLASISATFYMGSETDENSYTGMAYGADEYMNIEEGGCYTSIRLGKENENGQLLGKLIKNCNGTLRAIDLEDFPTLVKSK